MSVPGANHILALHHPSPRRIRLKSTPGFSGVNRGRIERPHHNIRRHGRQCTHKVWSREEGSPKASPTAPPWTSQKPNLPRAPVMRRKFVPCIDHGLNGNVLNGTRPPEIPGAIAEKRATNPCAARIAAIGGTSPPSDPQIRAGSRCRVPVHQGKSDHEPQTGKVALRSPNRAGGRPRPARPSKLPD